MFIYLFIYGQKKLFKNYFAFFFFLKKKKSISIVLEVLPKHPEFKELKKKNDPTLLRVRKVINLLTNSFIYIKFF